MLRKPLGRLAKKVTAKKGLLVFVAAIFLSVGIARVMESGIPFLGGSSSQPHCSFVSLTQSNFQSEVSKATGPIFVELGDGTADSRAQQIVLDSACAKYAGKVTFFQVNVTDQPAVANVFTGLVVQFLQSQGAQVTASSLPMPLQLLFTLDANGTPKIMNLGAGVTDTATSEQWIADGLSGKAMQPQQPAPSSSPSGTAPSSTPETQPTPAGSNSVPASPAAPKAGS